MKLFNEQLLERKLTKIVCFVGETSTVFDINNKKTK